MAHAEKGNRPARGDNGQPWDEPTRPISRPTCEVRSPHVPEREVRHSKDRFARPSVNRDHHTVEQREPAVPREYHNRPISPRSAEEEWRQRQQEGIQALLAMSMSVTANSAVTMPLFIGTKPDRPRSLLKDPALRGAIALMLSAGVAGGLGFVFWAFTAHRQSASSVGAISAEVSSITFLAGVSSLNLISIFGRFLPEAGWRARQLVAVGYGSASLTGLLVSTIFLFT